MATVRVGIIDDGYPTTQSELSVDDINKLTPLEDEWGSEIDLRDLNIKLVGEALRWKRKIQLEAFKHPNFYFNKRDWQYDFLVFDWEYRPESDSVSYLRKTLSLTKCPIYIYTAWNKIDHIPELLNAIQFSQFKEKQRFQILNKSDKESEDTILKSVLAKFQEGDKINWQGLDLIIKPSKHVIDADDFWLLRALIGSEHIVQELKKQDTNVIDELSIQKMFEQSAFKFYIDKGKSILSASNNQLVATKLGELKELHMIEALNTFGIDKLEEAREKGFTTIK